MKSLSDTRPIVVSILMILLVFLGLGGIGGGLSMLADPSGDLVGLPLVLLESVSVQNFLLPGMFLLVIMGILPLVAVYGLWKGKQTAWIATIGLSILLILWICFQIYLWGAPIAIQIVYLMLGVVMLGLCFVPSVRSYFRARPA
jgi:uncharacterized membrane protein